MKQKRFTAAVIIAMMLTLLLPIYNVSAAEISIIDWKMNNTYEGDSIKTNWWGQQMSQCAGYAEGTRWATSYGGEGWYTDAEDGSLAITANPKKKSSEESYLGRRIVTETIPDNSELILNLKFRTAPQPKGSAVEIWFVLNSQEEGMSKETQANTFMLKNSMTADMEHGFASTTSWPFTKKIPDRDPNTISFDYDKDYEVEITLKPALTSKDVYRYVAKIKEDGSDKGTIIVNEWPGFKPSQVKNPVQLTVASINRTDAREQEPIIFLNRISMKAKIPNTPIGAEYFPAENSRNAKLDTECYAEFEKAVEPITKSQVSVTGGAIVESVSMENDKRVNIELSNLAPKNAYTVNIKNVKAIVADSPFDYSWSFTTDSGVSFSRPYYSLTEELLKVDGAEETNLLPVDTDTDDYIDGAWGSANIDDDGKMVSGAVLTDIDDEFKVEDGYIWGYVHNQGAVTEDRALSKHFESIEDGDTLNLSTTVRFNYFKDDNINNHKWYAGGSVELTGSNGNLTLVQYGLKQGLQTLRFLNNGGADFYNNTAANSDIVTKGKTYAGYMSSIYTYIADANDLFKNPGTNAVDYMQLFANLENNPSANDGDIVFDLKAMPDKNDDSKYDLIMNVNGPNMHVTSSRKVDKSLILGLSDFNLVTSRSKNSNEAGEHKIVAIKDINMYVEKGDLLPTEGETNIYIDYENIADAAANAEILVVEKDAETGKILSLHLKSLNNITGSGTATIPVVLEEAGSKLEIYALNSAGGMVLLAEPETVDVIE